MAEQKPKTFIPLYGTFAASAFSACWAEVRREGRREELLFDILITNVLMYWVLVNRGRLSNFFRL